MERAAAISPEVHSSFFPPLESGGPREHLMWVEKTRRAVQIPIFASLNAVSPGAWIEYAQQLEETGVAGLEINYYIVAADPNVPGSDLEKTLLDIVASVTQEIKIPVAVKLSPYYTSTPNIVKELEKRGAKAVVLFNRFLQPDIDVDEEALVNNMALSTGAGNARPAAVGGAAVWPDAVGPRAEYGCASWARRGKGAPGRGVSRSNGVGADSERPALYFNHVDGITKLDGRKRIRQPQRIPGQGQPEKRRRSVWL